MYRNAVFPGKKKTNNPKVTPAALEVTHEAALTKPEIQYLVLPLMGRLSKEGFLPFSRGKQLQTELTLHPC